MYAIKEKIHRYLNRKRKVELSLDLETKKILIETRMVLEDMVLEIKRLRFEVLHVKFAMQNKKIEDGLALICPHCEKVFYTSEEGVEVNKD